jgi:D-3-phosphoglycerate dehydrogenase
MIALVTAQISAEFRDALEHEFGWTVIEDRSALRGVLNRQLTATVEAAIVEAEPLGAPQFEAMPRLHVMASVRAAPLNIDVASATARGVPVLCAPGRNAEAVADFTIGLIFASLRHIAQSHYQVRTGALSESPSLESARRTDIIWVFGDRGRALPYNTFKGPELRKQTLGVIGFGAIGRLVVHRARRLDMRVLVHDPYVTAGEIAVLDAEPTSLAELLQVADIVSLHARPSGRPVLGEAELRAMKKGAHLINTARAALVDYDALYAVLREGHLSGAALDVFPVEPLPPDNPFLSLENVTLTPHLAGASTNVFEHQSEILLANLRALFGTGNRNDLAVLNPEVLPHWHKNVDG